MRVKEYVDDDVVVAAYSKREEEVLHVDRKRVLKEALRLISIARQSDYLKVMVDTGEGQGVGDKPKMTVERAWRLLEVPPDGRGCGDDQVLMLYEMAVASTPAQKEALREALGVIAEERNSDELRQKVKGVTPGAFCVHVLRAGFRG